MVSGSFQSLRFLLIQAKKRSTTHRLGWIAKPTWRPSSMSRSCASRPAADRQASLENVDFEGGDEAVRLAIPDAASAHLRSIS